MSGRPELSCEDALRLLALHLDGELHGSTDTEVRAHLARCRGCFSRAEFERRLKAQLAAIREQPVPQRLAHRVRDLMDRFAAGSTPIGTE